MLGQKFSAHLNCTATSPILGCRQLAIHPADPQPFDRRGPPVYPGLVRYRWAGVDRYTLADLDAFRAAKNHRQSVRTVIPTDVTCCSLYAHPDVVPGRLSRRQSSDRVRKLTVTHVAATVCFVASSRQVPTSPIVLGLIGLFFVLRSA